MDRERSERRLAAIMFSDIVGYTAQMAQDEAAGLLARKRHRDLLGPLAERYRGELVDENGDELVLAFPSAVEAVNCALAAQEEMRDDRDLQLRVGIHLGDVVFEGGRVYGDGMNVASRIRPLAEPGGICISDEVERAVRGQRNIEVRSLGPQALKNVDRPVEPFAVSGTAGEASGVRAPIGARRRGTLRVGLAALAVVGLAVGLGLWASWPRPLGLLLDVAGVTGPLENPPLPDKPSLVVLPFANLSDDPEQEWFSDGITEDLITDLSRHSMLFVIASNSAFTYKGRAVDVEQVGRELGVHYVVEGSVRRAGDRIRVTAQLIDARSGFHRWSERYDRDLADVFEVQAALAEEIMDAVGVEVQAAESERLRRKPTGDLSAYEAYLKANWLFSGMTRAGHAEARVLLERAVELDPDFAAAWAMLGQLDEMAWMLAWQRDPARLERARELTLRALELDPDQAHAHVTLAMLHILDGRPAEAEAAARRAMAIDPSRPGASMALALIQARSGRLLEAAESLRRTRRVNPRANANALYAWIDYAAGRTEEAARMWEQAWTANADLAPGSWPLVHIYESQGRHAEARALVQAILEVNPELSAETLVTSNPTLPEERLREFQQSLRRAGMP